MSGGASLVSGMPYTLGLSALLMFLELAPSMNFLLLGYLGGVLVLIANRSRYFLKSDILLTLAHMPGNRFSQYKSG